MMARRDVQNLPCHVTRSEGNTRTFHLSPPPSLKIEEEFVSEREFILNAIACLQRSASSLCSWNLELSKQHIKHQIKTILCCSTLFYILEIKRYNISTKTIMKTSTAAVLIAFLGQASAFAPSATGRSTFVDNKSSTSLHMNMFDRFSRVAKANINNVLKTMEDPEKILNQAVEDMQVSSTQNYRMI